jgi:hypothetical protein
MGDMTNDEFLEVINLDMPRVSIAPAIPETESVDDLVESELAEMDLQDRLAWDRLPDEPMKWFIRFEKFKLLGPGRTVREVWMQESKHSGIRASGNLSQWSNHSKLYNWPNRAEAWDAWSNRQDELWWENKRRELRRREIEASERLHDKASKMLKMPLVEESRELKDGKTTVTIKPMRWSLGDVSRILEAASKIGRLAANMSTDNQSIKSDVNVFEKNVLEVLSADPAAAEMAYKLLESIQAKQDGKSAESVEP